VKESRYNVFVPLQEEHEVLAANLYTASILLISPSLYSGYERVVKKGQFTLDEFLNTDFAHQLVEGGFIIEDSYDEIAQVRVRTQIERFNQKVLNLTILPTLDCNAACIYCFESKSKRYITKDVQESILAFIARILPQKEGINVCWMGGEPLLSKPTIVNLSKSIRSICKTLDKTFEASIITNGLLLTKDMAHELTECGIIKAQVTLDGPKRFHDRLRVLRGGQGTWDIIINNIKESSKVIKINIRVHVTKENFSYMDELFQSLKNEEIEERVSIYFDTLNAVGEGCKSFSYSQENKLFTNRSFAEIVAGLYHQMHAKGFRGDIKLIKSNVCGAVALDSLVIEPDGTIQKCWLNIGFEKESGGNIKDGYNLTPNITKWLNWDAVYQGEECRDCKVLPICMGYCPYRHMNNHHETKCLFVRYNLEEYIKEIYINNKFR
jgi:uncharacterized protein